MSFIVPLSIFVSILALLAWIYFGTDYTIEDKQLKISCGPFRSRFNIDDIQNIKAQRTAISSPALSLDRLLIDDGTKQIAISPRNKSSFVKAITSVNPSIKVKL